MWVLFLQVGFGRRLPGWKGYVTVEGSSTKEATDRL